MKKITKTFLEFKQDLLSGKSIAVVPLSNILFITIISLIMLTISFIISVTLNKFIGNLLMIIVTILHCIFSLWRKTFYSVTPISSRLFFKFFGRYGKVISKSDWKRIKRNNKKAYKFFLDKENIGYCYYVSWALASWLIDVKVMYCSIKTENGKTGHSVIVKDNCVYDTNARWHYDFDEYIDMLDVEVYKIFEKEEYANEDFFDNIRQGFVDWCAERNVFCNPQ